MNVTFDIDIICQYSSNNTHFEVKLIVILAVNQPLCLKTLLDWVSCLSWKHLQVLLYGDICHTRKIVKCYFSIIYLSVYHFLFDIPLNCTSFLIILGQCSNRQRNTREMHLRKGENDIKGRKNTSDEARNYKVGFCRKLHSITFHLTQSLCQTAISLET